LARDIVRLNDIVLFAHLGVTQAERELGQRIHIDLELETDLTAASRSDALEDTLDYEAVYRRVEAVVEESRHRLVESLAGTLIEVLFGEFSPRRVRIRVRKPNVPFAGSLASAEVEMVRER